MLVRQLGAKAIVEGYDFRFGRGRAGTTDTLCETLCAASGLAFEEVPPLHYRGEPVSSSRVRSAIVSGDVALAAELLARPYRITGTVVDRREARPHDRLPDREPRRRADRASGQRRLRRPGDRGW